MTDRSRASASVEEQHQGHTTGWPWGRRAFLGWTGAILAFLGVNRRQAAASVLRAPIGSQQQPLDLTILSAVGAAVLPSELGTSGAEQSVREFARWAQGYRAGAELLHGYGSGKLTYAGALPLPAWRAQLAELDRQSRSQTGGGFSAMTIDQRRALIRTTLTGQKLTAFPAPQSAAHVVVGLLAWYYDTPGATDLCYNAEIMKNACRPLAQNPQHPLPLRRRSPDGGPHGLLDGGTR
ncbi:MAG: hypothetical protein U0132_23585 [Gemmatimonadaceae bacterium]